MSLLETRRVAKPWGRSDLPEPFNANSGEHIGEIWFVPHAPLNGLLAKYIFTSENLSVQCHPSDAQTLAKGLGAQGKEECWLILTAEPDAKLAIGFRERLANSVVKAAALDGSIMELLEWHPVKAGDFFYIPANTVHAIGAGITLVEVQQNSDITFRIFDYGRDRELHLEEGLAVALIEPYPASLHKHLASTGSFTLVEGPYFRLDRIQGKPDTETCARYLGSPLQVIPLDCTVGVGGHQVPAGGSAIAGSINAITVPESGSCLIVQEMCAVTLT